MPISAVSEGLSTFINILPFSHTVMISSEVQTLGVKAIYPHILYILGYTLVCIFISMIIEKIRSKR